MFKVQTGLQMHWNHHERCRIFVYKLLTSSGKELAFPQKPDMHNQDISSTSAGYAQCTDNAMMTT